MELLGAILLSVEGEYDIKALTNLFADNYTQQFTQQTVRKTAYTSPPTCPLAQYASFVFFVQKFTWCKPFLDSSGYNGCATVTWDSKKKH